MSSDSASRLAGEVEAGELLEHQTDSTEATVTSDSASAEWAYGSNFYLQDSYLSKLNKHHSQHQTSSAAAAQTARTIGGDGAEWGMEDGTHDVWRNGVRGANVHEDRGGDVRIYINPDMVYPSFFYSGNDFAAVGVCPGQSHLNNHHHHNNNKDRSSEESTTSHNYNTRSAEAESELHEKSSTPLWMLASGADTDISVPVVSMTCELVQSAVKGSAALLELKHLMARERANRDTMDVSRSDLAQLMSKDTVGRRVAASSSSSAAATPHRVPDDISNILDGYAHDMDRDALTMGGARDDEHDGSRSIEEGDAGRRVSRLATMQGQITHSPVARSTQPFRTPESGHTDHTLNGRKSHRRDEERNDGDTCEHPQCTHPSGGDETNEDGAGCDARGRKIVKAEAHTTASYTHAGRLLDTSETKMLRPSPSSASAAARIRAMQQQLPIYQCQAELMRIIGENAVTIVVGETGSGKTTQLVQYLYHRGYTQGEDDDEEEYCNSNHGNEGDRDKVGMKNRYRRGLRIGCTQPRRLAAVGVARRVSEEMQCPLGSTVGYAIHLDDTTSPQTHIKFMTDGVLLREIVHDPQLRQYRVIMLDEAHERSVDTDVLMGVLKRALMQRPDLKLIVTSATMETTRFSAFFNHAPCFRIPGRVFDVQLVYSPIPVSDYVAEAVFRICQLHLQMPLEAKHDVLVFMTGSDDVHGTCELVRRRLRELSPQHAHTLLLVPCLSEAMGVTSSNNSFYDTVYSNVDTKDNKIGATTVEHHNTNSTTNDSGSSSELANSVLGDTPAGFRKCVVATNVAETSLTIDGVRYVVDCGFMKTNVYRPALGMNTLQRYPVSQAQAQQRSGRAGRTTAGQCFRLYTEEQFATQMLRSGVPEIQRSSVESVVLLLKSIRGVPRLRQFDFMDPPPEANVRRSMWHLYMLDLVDERGEITHDGRRALDFPVAPALAKLLVDSAAFGCSVEVSQIVALITADPKNLFELPKGKEELAQQTHSHFFAPDSDHLTLLNVLTQFIAHGQARQWARDHFLHLTTLLRACAVHRQLVERMHRLRLAWVSCGLGQLDRVRFCIARAFALQAAQRSVRGSWSEYRPLLSHGVTCHVHPSSALCGRAVMPAFVVYHDLLFATKEYLVLVTAVEPEWLVESTHGLLCMRRVGAKWLSQSSRSRAATSVNDRDRSGTGREDGGAPERSVCVPETNRTAASVPSSSSSPSSLLGMRNAATSSAAVSENQPRPRASPSVSKTTDGGKSKKRLNFGFDRRRDNV